MLSGLVVYNSMDGKLLCPRDSPGKNTGVGCHALIQGLFLTQGTVATDQSPQGKEVPQEPGSAHLGTIGDVLAATCGFLNLTFWSVY